MEPAIRYARTADGVSIAYWTMGEGPAVVYMPPMPYHLRLDWRFPIMRQLYAWLTRRHRLVRFDERGRGLSQRDGIEYTSPAGELLDMEAVIDQLQLDRFSIFAWGLSVTGAVHYAARHPERVERLALVNPLPPFPEVYADSRLRAVGVVLPADYEVWTELVSYMVEGFQGGEMARGHAALLRDGMTHEQQMRYATRHTPESSEAFVQALGRMEAPTLIVYQAEAIVIPGSAIERMTAEIRDARMVALEGLSVGGSVLDPMMQAAVDAFFSGDDDVSTAAQASLPAGMAVILFVDIESSTALTERMGDSAFRAASREIDEQVRTAVRNAGGTPIEGKVMGDGVMGVFASAAQAIAGAHACRELSAASELRLHIGLHAGDVIREENNVYGGAVNIASRICDASTPGEILVSATVRDLARTSAGVAFEDRGERALKGIDDAIRVFAVREQE